MPLCITFSNIAWQTRQKSRARGSIALKAALDCEYCLSKNESIVKLSKTNMKDAEPPNLQTFKLLSVGLDDGGSSAVLELTEGTASERNKPLTANQKLAKDSYIEVAIKSGIWNDEGFAGLHLDDWRPAFYAIHSGDNTDTKKRAFSRSRDSLSKDGLVAVRGDIYLWNDEGIVFAISMRRDTGQQRDMSRCRSRIGGTGHNPIGVSHVPLGLGVVNWSWVRTSMIPDTFSASLFLFSKQEGNEVVTSLDS